MFLQGTRRRSASGHVYLKTRCTIPRSPMDTPVSAIRAASGSQVGIVLCRDLDRVSAHPDELEIAEAVEFPECFCTHQHHE